MQAKQPEELEFARRLSDGEPVAVLRFEARYRRVVKHAFGRAWMKWRPDAPMEAEDYVQDFIGFLFDDGGRRLRSFAGRASFGAWLYTVALRYFQRRLSRSARDKRSKTSVLEFPDRTNADPEVLASAALEAEQLRTAVSRLPAEEQLLVRLFYVEGLNATEVARALGRGTSGVRMRKMRILQRLKGELESMGVDP